MFKHYLVEYGTVRRLRPPEDPWYWFFWPCDVGTTQGKENILRYEDPG